MERQKKHNFDTNIWVVRLHVHIKIYNKGTHKETQKKDDTKGSELIVSLPMHQVSKEQKIFLYMIDTGSYQSLAMVNKIWK